MNEFYSLPFCDTPFLYFQGLSRFKNGEITYETTVEFQLNKMRIIMKLLR